MKIQIPNQINNVEDYTEGELMFMALMYMVCTRYTWNSRYNMNVGDLRRIVFNFKANNQAIFGNHMIRLRDIFEFAQTDAYNVLVAWRTIRPLSHFGRPVTKDNSKINVGSQTVEIHDIGSIQIWSYLMGVWFSGNDIVSESENILEYTDNARITEGLEYNNFNVNVN